MIYVISFLYFACVIFVGVYIIERHRQKHYLVAQKVGATTFDLMDQGMSGGRSVVLSLMDTLTQRFGRHVPWMAVKEYNKKLLWAGSPYGLKGEEVYLAKIILGFLPPVIIPVVVLLGGGGLTTMMLAFSGLLFYFAPDMWLSNKIQTRHRAISKQLLTFVDTLAICSDAGLNLNEAIKRTVEFMPGALGDEFRRFHSDTEAGASRSEALNTLASRVGIEDLSNLVLAITQAEKYGTPVANILREQVKLMRNNRRNKAQEVAQTASIKILLPVVVFDFLPLLVILLGPAAVNMGHILGF